MAKSIQSPTIDVTSQINQLEAGRIKTILEREYNLRMIQRMLWGFTPEDIAKECTRRNRPEITAEIIARAAGRE